MRRGRGAPGASKFTLPLALFLAAAGAAAAPPEPDADVVAFMRFAIAQTCEKPIPEGAEAGPELVRRFAAEKLLEARTFEFQGRPGRAQYGLLLNSGDEVKIQRLFPLGLLRRVTVEIHREFAKGRLRPAMSAAVGADCRVLRAARIDYDEKGDAETLVILGRDLRQVLSREPLNPTFPAVRSPGREGDGIRVALVDTGVNYSTLSPTALPAGLKDRLSASITGTWTPAPMTSIPRGRPFSRFTMGRRWPASCFARRRRRGSFPIAIRGRKCRGWRRWWPTPTNKAR